MSRSHVSRWLLITILLVGLVALATPAWARGGHGGFYGGHGYYGGHGGYYSGHAYYGGHSYYRPHYYGHWYTPSWHSYAWPYGYGYSAPAAAYWYPAMPSYNAWAVSGWGGGCR
jgi:hypothetical protein